MEVQRVEGGLQPILSYNTNTIRAELQAVLDEAEPGLEHQFFLDILQRRGGLALELGSGTGKKLLPYLVAGVHVHGVENSVELIAICQSRAQKLGLIPTLHRQTLDKLDIPMSFKTIYAPDNIFQKISNLETAEFVLQKFFEHLEIGGMLALTLNAPDLRFFTQQNNVWNLVNNVERMHDRARIVHSATRTHKNIEQTTVTQHRYDIIHANGQIESHLEKESSRWYYKFEFKMMLERAGFSEISMLGDYTPHTAIDGHTKWIFLATKRG